MKPEVVPITSQEHFTFVQNVLFDCSSCVWVSKKCFFAYRGSLESTNWQVEIENDMAHHGVTLTGYKRS